jgi:ABC-type transporter Mla maintaining outer membrane lipid asymmetry permease subunit MlaE
LLIVAKLVVEKLLRVLGIVSMLFFIAYRVMAGAIATFLLFALNVFRDMPRPSRN